MGCDSPTALLANSNQFTDMAPTSVSNPFNPAHPLGMADPFWMQKMQTLVNLNVMLAAQQGHLPNPPVLSPTGYPLPSATSPPLKLPFGGLSHPFFTNSVPTSARNSVFNQFNRLPTLNGKLKCETIDIQDEKMNSTDMLRLKAKQQSEINRFPIG